LEATSNHLSLRDTIPNLKKNCESLRRARFKKIEFVLQVVVIQGPADNEVTGSNCGKISLSSYSSDFFVGLKIQASYCNFQHKTQSKES
jgi:hypothetical protein